MADVESVGNLALLAIADTVDPGRGLLCDNLPDGICETRLERRGVNLAAGLPRLQERQQVRWTRQAADMGRQSAVAAELHRRDLGLASSGIVTRTPGPRKLWGGRRRRSRMIPAQHAPAEC